MLLTVRRHTAMFKAVEALFNLSDPHCIISESLLNFANCFCLGIPRFLTKLNAVSLLQASCHLKRNENVMNTCYTTLLSGSHRQIWRCKHDYKLTLELLDTEMEEPEPVEGTEKWSSYVEHHANSGVDGVAGS
ncbi:hypothetical protein B7P43_G08466 [Cryptotermes secundus]|uniref:Uncharacterized protein n=1 Tax=Cryptotermes secundus TaxID=105785 RepID=A0A2J7R5Z8_9NEOP|nr:hypothetical protein B7P43_G08466 [Cryptotermes secundus]